MNVVYGTVVNVSNLHILDITLEVTSETPIEVIIPIIAEVTCETVSSAFRTEVWDGQ